MTDEALQSARELRQSILFNIMPNTFTEMEKLNADKDQALATLLSEWRSRGEREGMERAAALQCSGCAQGWEFWNIPGEPWTNDYHKRSDGTAQLCGADRIRAAAPPSTLKEPPEDEHDRDPEPEAIAQAVDRGASPQSETPRRKICLHCGSPLEPSGWSIANGEKAEVRAAEQRVISCAEAWGDDGAASGLLDAVEALRRVRHDR